jgi:Na+/H+-dicarboxylate symporter
LNKLALHWQILIGLALGLVVGIVVNLVDPYAYLGDGALRSVAAFLVRLNGFVGDLFLRGLRFIAVPIVLFSLIGGAASLNDIGRLSRIGGRTVVLYLATTSVAITVGLLFANLTQPGTWVSDSLRDALAAQHADRAAMGMAKADAAPDVWTTFLEIVPKNPFASLAEGNMLQVVFIALAVGIALTLIPEERSKPVIAFADAMTDVVIKLVHVLMALAPYAVFCLIARVMATMGLEVLGALLVYSLTVIAGLAAMMFGVYPAVLKAVTGLRLGRFYDAIAPAQLLAFSSSSSSATLPVTMECVEERLGVSDEVTSFVVPLGATINMDGTALYQGVAALFIAQIYSVDLSIVEQLTIVLTATLASIGTAGVPGVGLIMLVIVLQSVNMPADAMAGGIAIIFGVDRILDMCRTACNVTGDCMVAATIAHLEGALATEEDVAARQAAPLDENP